MFPSFSKQLAYSYAKIPNSSQDDLELPNIHMRAQLQRPESRLPQTIKMVACSLAFMLIGFFLGQGFAQRGLSFSSSLALAVKPHLFKMEAIYGAKPSNESDTAWSALMPKRGGFFNHPKIAPERSAYAVFHQLHCLNALRGAYWEILDAATSPTALEIDSIPFEISPEHMTHCIDLLRQSLMCSPDLTVEIKNETLGGVTGFGTIHQCRNWDQLMGWMEKWEDVGAPKHHPGEGSSEHGHHHGH